MSRSQGANKLKGSFLSRNVATLDKLAELTKTKNEAVVGSTAKKAGRSNFVFAAVSPQKSASNAGGGTESGETAQPAAVTMKKAKSKPPAKKKAKTTRSIDENSMDTIFGFM